MQEETFWFDQISDEHGFDLVTRELSVSAADPLWESGDNTHVFARHSELNFSGYDGKIRHRERYRPLMLICETVNICNHHCIICAYDSQSRRKQQMPMEIFDTVLRQYVDIGGGHLSLTPMVGDLFLDKLLPERLTAIDHHRPAIRHLSATTNAGFVKRYSDAELADILAHFDTIAVSVYETDDEEFFAMTKRRTFQELRTGLDRILRLARHKVIISFRCLKQRDDDFLANWVSELPGYATTRAQVTIPPNTRAYANWGILDATKPLPFGAASNSAAHRGATRPMQHPARGHAGLFKWQCIALRMRRLRQHPRTSPWQRDGDHAR